MCVHVCVCRVTERAYLLHNQCYSVFIVWFGLFCGIGGKNHNNNKNNRPAVRARAEFELVTVVLRVYLCYKITEQIKTCFYCFSFISLSWSQHLCHQRIAFIKLERKKRFPNLQSPGWLAIITRLTRFLGLRGVIKMPPMPIAFFELYILIHFE